ncbi:hypothetical protein RhiirA5_467434 [Rhizophagus irregularis]|uniref:Crinkler effector protein N-terminal domain-containing protein n=4 Tax=Rhizophagus irregularis TaxID=588596 RepID=A0A2I1G721_9GLOM|nr:hypothetical protein GLOIN_2v1520982 [Rhizophagus irregularis DAOM 181602=DAOM 197198]EXX58568.1 hypothetical protein RirG_196820 [Rhizophagus irregularis DAOM 197198w]PKC16886.1 hypothetical protein RhiirA5_467434 [Rhizophagus irregularis]PKC73737.1 hypothetical protein RhiirA1_437379 [Rhizophagus irregularis]PKY18583.1 hypothetical protein RhiirB3_522868 [Rhizophagus irregularis]PKY42429.1 hypothetical protein RhiirA4_505399 [Rhizophagus irregularis]|eukprot:XP_025186908.1 hypothetical protein GLOIN_2v1520982 [Rhizophagus irregularis DAOM 181602=DAOM 197198]
MQITLKCFVLGENLSNSFKVKIDTGDTVLDLKKLIFEKKKNDITSKYPSELKLWKVDIGKDDEEKRKILRNQSRYTSELEGTELSPDESISKSWHSTGNRQPKENSIHVIVRGKLD